MKEQDTLKMAAHTPSYKQNNHLLKDLQGGYKGCEQQIALQFSGSKSSPINPSPNDIYAAGMKLGMGLKANSEYDGVTGWGGGGRLKKNKRNKRTKRVKRTKRRKHTKRTKRAKRVKQYKKTKKSKRTRR